MMKRKREYYIYKNKASVKSDAMYADKSVCSFTLETFLSEAVVLFDIHKGAAITMVK